MIYNKGINDMPKGWRKENDLNGRIYWCWAHMIERCYSEKSLEKRPTYNNCYVCDKWLKLSGFIEDIEKIDGYELWINNKDMALDKDIKNKGVSKCYCLENCIFVSKEENTKQSSKTREWRKQRQIAQYDLDMNLIKIWECIMDIKRKTGIDDSSISKCCRKKRKTAGGYIWRYVEE